MIRFLKVEITKSRESFALLVRIIEQWIPDKLQSSRFMYRDPSDLPESTREVQKLLDVQQLAKKNPKNYQKQTQKIQTLNSSKEFLITVLCKVYVHDDRAFA